MKHLAVFAACALCAVSARAMPAACEEIQAFVPEQHSRDYALLGSMQARCEAALAASPDRKILRAATTLKLSDALQQAHATRVEARAGLLRRTRAVVDQFRQAGPKGVPQMGDPAFVEALQKLDAIARDGSQARSVSFVSFLPDAGLLVLKTPPDASDEVLAIAGAVQTNVAAAAARSDAQMTLLDRALQDAVATARGSVGRLRTGAALVADKGAVNDLAGSVSAEVASVQASVAFARFFTAVKGRTVLQQASMALGAGALSSVRSRVAYLDRAYAQFSGALPGRVRAAVASGPAADFQGRLQVLRQSAESMAPADAEARLQAYTSVRAGEFDKYKKTCAARFVGNAGDIGQLDRDLGALAASLPQLQEADLRIFVYESIVDRLETARALCGSTA